MFTCFGLFSLISALSTRGREQNKFHIRVFIIQQMCASMVEIASNSTPLSPD